MSKVLSEEKKQQVIALGKLGWSLRRIQQATGVRRETASAYLKAAGVEVYLPGWGHRAPAKPAIEVTPDFIAPFSRKPTVPSVCEAYCDLIEQALNRGRNGKAIWQDLVSEHGFSGSYQAVKRFQLRHLVATLLCTTCGMSFRRLAHCGEFLFSHKFRARTPPRRSSRRSMGSAKRSRI